MDINLDQLNESHPRLPTEIALGLRVRAALALQRRGHGVGVVLVTTVGSEEFRDLLKWTQVDINELPLHDVIRVTEDGAEGVALALGAQRLRWKVLRRMQREESADWLLEDTSGLLIALEVSGVDRGSIGRRLTEKIRQVRRAEDVDERWAAVVSFENPAAALVRADQAYG